MDLTEKAIEKIEFMTPLEKHVIQIDGVKYSKRELKPVLEPRVQTITFNTLDGFIDFANGLDVDKKELMVIVNSETDVLLRAKKVDPKFKKYEFYARSEAGKFITNYKFGYHYDPEEFMIALQTSFIKTETRDLLIKVAGNLSGESESRVEDDGITQSTTVGRAVKTKVKIENPVMLKPFRSFAEIEQIESPFVFRIGDSRSGAGEPALFESDCGQWKLTAMKRIQDYLKNNLKDIVVYA